MQEVYEFIKSCPCYYLATVEGDQPHVRPFGTILLYEDKLYIQTGHKKDVANQLATNPKAELCAYDGKGVWIRIKAVMVEDARTEAKKAMLDAYPDLRAMYDENDGNTAVYYMTQATATLYSFTAAPKVIEF